MMLKVIGAVLILLACGSFGLKLVMDHRVKEQSLQQLIDIIDYMTRELEFRLTPLPVLARQVVDECTGILSNVFMTFSQELESQIAPDVCSCMSAALAKSRSLPPVTREAVIQLGKSLGKFDIGGQLRGLAGVQQFCRNKLTILSRNRDNRLRGYQTLALCAGAALVILFI